MINTICLDNNYSTTQLLTKEKPILENKPEHQIETKLFLAENSDSKEEGGLRTKGYFKKSYDEKPLISIITVVFNGEKYIEQTIQSVMNQSYDNVEYIIIDGGSNDTTVDIIKKYEDQIDYWVSEPDNGIYNALNKGISLCTGEYGAFLNADDWYNKDTLQVVSEESKKACDYICGDISIVDENDGTFQMTMSANIDRYKTHMPFGHPALFVKRVYLLEFGFDEHYTIIADYDFVLRLIEKKLSYSYIPKALTNFREGGVSTTQNLFSEHFHLYYKHFGLFHAIKYSFLFFTKYGQIILSLLRKLKSKSWHK